MDDRRFLLLKGSSGMGNRLGALLQAIVYARLSSRKLIVDWNDFRYSPDGSDVFHRLFSCPIAGRISEVPAGARVAPAVWQDRIHAPIEDMIRETRVTGAAAVRNQLSIDVDRLDHAEAVAVVFDYKFDLRRLRAAHGSRVSAWWGEAGQDELARRLLREHLALSPSVRAAVDAFRRRHFGGHTVGVHVRQTDNMNAKTVATRGVTVSLLEEALGQYRRSHPDSTVFLATDNLEVERAFRRRHAPVVAIDKWYPEESGQAIHGNSACPDKLKMAEDALLDLHLLGECDALICSSAASYARLARLLSPRDDLPVIDVRTKERPPGRALMSVRRVGAFARDGLNRISRVLPVKRRPPAPRPEG